MKHIILLSMIFNFFSLHAQNHLVGIKGGVNWTNVTSIDFLPDPKTRTGMALGVTYDFMIKHYLSLETGITYNQRGFGDEAFFTTAVNPENGQFATIKYNYDYVSVPIKIGYNYGKKAYFFANLGAVPSLLIQAKSILPKVDFNGGSFPGQTNDETKNVNAFDFAGQVELGIGYKLKEKFWLYSSFAYQHSFTNTVNDNFFSYSDFRHNGMNLSVGLKYALGKAKE